MSLMKELGESDAVPVVSGISLTRAAPNFPVDLVQTRASSRCQIFDGISADIVELSYFPRAHVCFLFSISVCLAVNESRRRAVKGSSGVN